MKLTFFHNKKCVTKLFCKTEGHAPHAVYTKYSTFCIKQLPKTFATKNNFELFKMFFFCLQDQVS